MIFIVGGRKQGKEAFAREHFPEWKDEKCADGKSASWEEFLKTNFGINLHEMVRRRMEEGAKAEELERDMAEELLRECPERILITDEIGCGIVPMDAFSRCYREVVGRICCQLAGKAQEVWRVTAGIGQKIKQKGETMMTQEKKGQKTAGINEQVMSGEELDSLRKQAGDAVREFLAVGKMKQGNLFVVGCSSSEIVSSRIGSYSSKEIGEAVFQEIWEECEKNQIYLAAQCCEHLNRALILEREAAEKYGYEIVNVVPQLKAGGSFATAAYERMKEPVAVERISAHGGMDIGDTLIGMHLRQVAVPVRIETKCIGKAHVVCARVRPKFIGGIRARYDEGKL